MKHLKKASVIPLSGGLDSTYLLYKQITENPNDDVFVVHVNLIKTGERYYIQEWNAATNIVNWFNLNGFYNIVDFAAPKMDLTNFPIGLDTDGVLVMAQKMMYKVCKLNRYHTAQLFIGLVADDGNYARFRNQYLGIGMNNRIWTCLIDSMIGRVNEERWKAIDHTIQYPLYHQGINKSDIINLLPTGLLDLIWYCRKPTNSKPCGKCASCKTHQLALVKGKENAFDKLDRH